MGVLCIFFLEWDAATHGCDLHAGPIFLENAMAIELFEKQHPIEFDLYACISVQIVSG